MSTTFDALGLQLQIERHLKSIEKLFMPNMRLTLVVRDTNGNPEAEILLTRDPDLAAVIETIRRRGEGAKP